MLAFGIRYLNGFVVASEPDSRERAEWPPHPARVFMALVAAHFETGADPSEREALEWVEKLEPSPNICAGEARARAIVTHYVPVNDKVGPAKAILQSAPTLTRDRQPRTFARAWLDDEVVYVYWPTANLLEATRKALETLCGKVTRVGHSSSLVHMWVASQAEIAEPTWVPEHDHAEIQLRVTGPKTLEYLEDCYNQEKVERWEGIMVSAGDDADKKAQKVAKDQLKKDYAQGPPVRRRPELRLYAGYARPKPAQEQAIAPGTVFSPHIVVRVLKRESGRYQELDVLCAPQVVQRWRDAILTQTNDLPESVRQLLSGHNGHGAPLEEPHLAFIPLAFVGHTHADGHLLGMGIVLPDEAELAHRRHALRAIAGIERLVLGRLGTWRIDGVAAVEPPWNLRSAVWTAHPGGATHWSTVTPIAFDRHPKQASRSSYQSEIAEMIVHACTRIGLPEPRDVIVTSVSAHLGVPPAHAFPRIERKDGSRRRHTHAILIFHEPVRGPILLGAGRYRGYGVCRPLHDTESVP